VLAHERERNDRTSGGEVGWIERMVACWIDKALHKIFFTAHLMNEPGIIEGKIEGEKGRGK
jgi:hypothetical protein